MSKSLTTKTSTTLLIGRRQYCSSVSRLHVCA